MRKYLFNFILMISLIAIGSLSYKNYRLQKRIDSQIQYLDSQLRNIEGDLTIGRAQTVYNTEKLDELSDRLSDEMLTDIKNLSGKIVAIGESVIRNKDKGSGKLTRVVSLPSLSKDPSLPDLDVKISTEDCLWGYNDYHLDAVINTCTKNLEYYLDQQLRITLVESMLPNGSVSTNLHVDEIFQGKSMKRLGVESFEIVRRREQLLPSLRLWSPHLDLGVSLFANTSFEFSPSVGFSVSGYGLTTRDESFRFARVSVGSVLSRPSFGFFPVGINLTKGFNLLSDIWIWPGYEYSDGHRGSIVLSTTL